MDYKNISESLAVILRSESPLKDPVGPKGLDGLHTRQDRFSTYHLPGVVCPRCESVGIAKVVYEERTNQRGRVMSRPVSKVVFDKAHRVKTDDPHSIDEEENVMLAREIEKHQTPWLCLGCGASLDSDEFLNQL